MLVDVFFFFQAEDGIRDLTVTGVQTCALPISGDSAIASIFVPPTSTPMRTDAVYAQRDRLDRRFTKIASDRGCCVGSGGRAPLGRSESLADGTEVVRRVRESADRHAERVLVPARVHLHRDHQPAVFLAQART